MTKDDAMKNDNARAAEAREIEQQLQKMRDKAQSLGESVKTMGAEELRHLKAKTKAFLDEARDHGGEYVRVAGKQAQEKLAVAQENLTETVRQKPLTSIAVAAGVGFVLALLARR